MTGLRRAIRVLLLGALPFRADHGMLPERRSTSTSTNTQFSALSGSVVQDTFWSQSLGVRKRYVAWLPPSYGTAPDRRYPVAYYLHGATGDETNWTTLGRLHLTLDSLAAAGVPEMIVVMPDGDDGYYTTWNSLGDYAGCRRSTPPGRQERESVDDYCVPWPHYDDYIARDLVRHVDSTYRTVGDRRHRGIAGLSMGGYGAISLALAYPDVFSAAASHSGVLAPAVGLTRNPPLAGRFDLDALRSSYGPNGWERRTNVFGKDSLGWAARDPRHLAARVRQARPALMPALRADCGVDDPYLPQSRAFRDAMTALGIPLEYAEHDGAHAWDYWRRHSATSAAWLATRLSVP